MPRDNLQAIVDGIRVELRKGFGGLYRIEHPQLRDPLELDVIVDGVTAWMVRVKVGERVLFDATDTLCVHPDELLSSLYVFLRACIKAATTSPARPS